MGLIEILVFFVFIAFVLLVTEVFGKSVVQRQVTKNKKDIDKVYLSQAIRRARGR